MTEATTHCSRSKVPQLYDSQQLFLFRNMMSHVLAVSEEANGAFSAYIQLSIPEAPTLIPLPNKKACRQARTRLPLGRTQQMCGGGQDLLALLDGSYPRYTSAETGTE